MPHAPLTPMQQALALAERAAAVGEVPVGAVIVADGKIIATSANRMRASGDATAHAEMEVIRQALETLGTGRLTDCDLYVTLEPCTMCAGAIAHARLRRLYFGAEDKKAGAVENGVRFFDSQSCNHRPEIISGIGAEASAELLRKFFAARR
ncbi:MAG TPA: nucleoside deaminase [Devosia sp.]|nr:nucleoside deaminase [Devosia sp.]